MAKTRNRFSPEVRERAVRMVLDHEKDYLQSTRLDLTFLLDMSVSKVCRSDPPSDQLGGSESLFWTSPGLMDNF